MKTDFEMTLQAGIEAVIDNLPSSIFLVDREKNIVLANRSASILTRIPKDKLVGRSSAHVLRCKYLDKGTGGCAESGVCRSCMLRSVIDDSFISRTEYSDVETEFHFADRGPRILRLSTRYFPESDTVMVAINDMTAARRVEAQRIENRTLKAALETSLAVCHEISQPLQVISGYLEMLMFDGGLRDSSFHCLQEIRKQIQRLRDISTGLQNLRTLRIDDQNRLDSARDGKALSSAGMERLRPEGAIHEKTNTVRG
ncbi:PAS domain-containing protein [bacterium]|nr:PAS domain-containing protein [bacterium]